MTLTVGAEDAAPVGFVARCTVRCPGRAAAVLDTQPFAVRLDNVSADAASAPGVPVLRVEVVLHFLPTTPDGSRTVAAPPRTVFHDVRLVGEARSAHAVRLCRVGYASGRAEEATGDEA